MKEPSMRFPLFLVAVIFCFCCNKTSSPDKSYTPQYIDVTITGRVTDEADMPVSGSVVRSGDASTTTDVDGSFTLNNITVDKNAAFIKVEKDGYFHGAKTLVASADQSNRLTIKLIRKKVAGSFAASGAASITVPDDGGKIVFESNSVVSATGNTAYTGTVAVSASFINPEAPDFRDIMPGTLRGITTNNQETGLQSFGMMAVELDGENGEKLQLAPGKKATLHFPIPDGLQAEAPATIPLWSLDESTGLWKEEGSAVRQGSEYVGTVSHFSFWNCDAPFPVTDFTCTLQDQQGNKMIGTEVMILAPGNNGSGNLASNGFTDADGVISGKLPTNKTLQMKVYDKCRNLLLEKTIGPFSSVANLGVLTISSSASQLSISGTVKNCYGAPVANGYVTMELENIFYNIPVSNGQFSGSISRCKSEAVTASLTPYDITGKAAGPAVNVPVSNGTVEAGQLMACGTTLDTYIRYTVNGVNYEILPPRDSIYVYIASETSTFTAIGGMRQRGPYEDIVVIFGGGALPGSYTVFIADVYDGNNSRLYERNSSYNTTVTEYGTTPGSYITGTFSGTLRDTLNTVVVPINCSYRVQRP